MADSTSGVTLAPRQPDTLHPLALIQAAIEKGVDAEQLSKLMDLQERYERNRAAEAFGAALTKFQSMCPTVFKSRTAKVKTTTGGEYSYKFASFDNIMRAVSPILAQCDLAVTFATEQLEKSPNILKVSCCVRHGIHVQETTCFVPIPDMKVNDTQKYGAAVSYAKRYTLCAALNIVVSDEDNDAAGLIDAITEEQVAEIYALLERKGIAAGPVCKFIQVERIEDVRQADYVKLVDYLRRKKDAVKGGAT